MSLGNFGFSEAIALIAVVVAFYYGWQNSKLTKRLLAKEQDEAEAKSRADLGANLVKIGKGYRLKIFNRGRAAARNVRIEVDESEGRFLDQGDVDSKFPHERMEPHQGVELFAFIGWESRSKYAIKLVWDDDFKTDNEKMVYPTI